MLVKSLRILSTVLLFIVSTGASAAWIDLAPLPTVLSDLSAQSLDGRIYAGQGVTTGPAGRWEQYDPASDSWDSLSGVGVIHQRASSVADGKIYAMGGVETGGPLNRADVFDSATNNWTPVNSMSTTRGLATAATVGGQIYVFGGYPAFGASTASMTAERYDPVSDTWHAVAPMLRPRQGASAVAFDGKIYLFGGINGSGVVGQIFWDIVDVYDPIADAWVELPTRMPTPRTDAGAVRVGGEIYLVGGSNQSAAFLTAFESYEPQADTWSSHDTTNLLPRTNLGAAALGDRIYVVGGNGIRNGRAGAIDSVQAFDVQRTVPEPGAISLILVGLGGLLWGRWRNRTA